MQIQTEAIILRRTNFGEADRIMNFLTPNDGKVSAIAKGIRRSKSKLAGDLELFATCNVGIVKGRSEMGTITSARLIKFYGEILHDYERMSLAYSLIKMINKVTESVTEPDFYYLLRDGLEYLNDLTIDYRYTELWFKLQLEVLLGRGINLAKSADGVELQADKIYNFDFSEMAFEQSDIGDFAVGQIKLLRLAQYKTPPIMRQVLGLDSVLPSCLWLVRNL